MTNRLNKFHFAIAPMISLTIAACGSGGSSSGSGQQITELVRCVAISGTIVQNNCSFNVNIRYFSSALTGPAPQEAVTQLLPGQTFDVAPFDSQSMSGVPACQAPLRPSQIFQATSINCI